MKLDWSRLFSIEALRTQPQVRMQLGVLLILVLLLLRFLLTPILAWQAETRDQLILLSNYQARTGQLATNQHTLEQLAQQLEAQQQALQTWLGSKQDERELQATSQQQLEQRARQLGIRVQRIEWGQAYQQQRLLVAPLRLQLLGQLDQLHQLLNELEIPQPEQIYQLTSLSLSPDRRQAHQYAMHLDILSYALLPETAMPAEAR